MLSSLRQYLGRCWRFLRQVSGDDAYERYLQCYGKNQVAHQHQQPPLSREEFFQLWQQEKWDGVKRCC
ncbi:Protein of unknown function [Methylobacillus rhizosphaerae]|uniref:YbdD/YjiX family protein n=1 Tax=Methylobacillus rhizosphaerae TaxID=551994 RepID=A0A239A5B3_9PROT|nr:YbdD/YjiX family protein [Methylobacillus rhizosphaerae]SNR90689.1 Protein of unknown function [Methylobacillus rhizosphaerae]